MTLSDIADRRQLRRKLTFWRILAFLVLAAAIVALWAAMNGGELSNPRGRDHIARISITGVIQDDADLLDRLNSVAKNKAAKGLIVSINSPGGTTYGGEAIYKAIRKVAANKPVVSDVRTLAASAGYMVAIAGDRIVAGDTSITGSIGVIYQYPQIKGLLDKLGVSMEEIKSAPLKAEPSPFHPAPEGAKEAMRAMLMDTFDWFVDLVAERRKLDRAEALALSDGRVFSGRQAVELKLVDAIGGSEQIRDYFAELKVDRNLPIVEWPRASGGGSLLFGRAAETALNAIGLDWLANALSLRNISEDKLLLDGLVSVWQVDGN